MAQIHLVFMDILLCYVMFICIFSFWMCGKCGENNVKSMNSDKNDSSILKSNRRNSFFAGLKEYHNATEVVSSTVGPNFWHL